MILKRLILALIAFTSANTFAIDPLVSKADSAYNNKEFQIAIDSYESLKGKGLVSTQLYLNLGNAYYRKNIIGKSILNFERAIKLDGSNEDAIFNLSLAKSQIQDQFEAIPNVSYNNILVKLNLSVPNNLLSLISVFIISIAALVFIYGKKNHEKKLLKYAKIGVSVGLVLGFIAIQESNAVQAQHNGIITKASANIFSEPNESATLLFELHEGTKLYILSESNTWLNIKAPNNEIGWIEKSSLSEI